MLTREAFQAIYDQGPDAVYTLIMALEQRVQQLEERLAKDSHNSHKPPSSDGLAKKPVPSSLRTKSGRKPGGQKGHRGCTLSPVECPDAIVSHVAVLCACCGASLKNAPIIGEQCHQVFDLPPLRVYVSEHRAQVRRCRCGAATTAQFPKEAWEGVQYGPRLKALCVYLRDYQLLPFARLVKLLSDLFEAPLGAGTLANTLSCCARTLKPVTEAIKMAVQRSRVAHFDETGLRVGGHLQWLHSASTQSLTHYFCHERRGKEGADAAGILPNFLGRAVHDGFSSYARYPCRHSLCNAHHLRELIRLEEAGQEWAKKMKRLLLEMKAAVERAKERGKRQVSLLLECRLLARYRKLLVQGYAQNPPPAMAPRDKRARCKQTPARNLLLRLDRHRAWVLAFLFDFSVPFDNNLAERDLRMMKVRQKISGGFRTDEGVRDFCVVRGYISTLRKQKIHVLSALEQAFRGKPVYPCTAVD
jgi:transposase